MINFNFFFSSRRRHTRWPRDWSSDVCSSDLIIRMIIAILLVLIMAGCDNNAGATDESTASGNYTVYGGSVGGIWRSEERRVGEECGCRSATVELQECR